MRFAVLGRTKMLLDAAYALIEKGFELSLVATAPATPEAEAGQDEFQALADEVGCGFIVASRFNDQHIDTMHASASDVAISMNWPTIISRQAMECFRRRVINAHGSDLPKFRGNACPNWAIINGEPRIGLSFHYMEPDQLDTGDIIYRTYIDNTPDLYIGDVYKWLETAVPHGFVSCLERMSNPSFAAEKQDHRLATRAYPRRPEDAKLEFGMSADHLHRIVRASSRPFGGAFCFYEGKRRVTVWRASIVRQDVPIFAVPGQLMYFQDGRAVVACGDGQGLRLDEYQTDDGTPLGKSLRARFH
jgi:methionyl-tRNA formyltransferase